MKKSILGVCFVLAGMSAFAQNGANTAVNLSAVTPRVSTSNDIRQLANQLQLNEGQYIRLRDLSKARQEQITEINSMYSNDPAMRQAKTADVQQEFDNQLAQSVTAKQFTAYLQLQGRNPASSGSSFQAGGYGGRSFESGATGESGIASPEIELQSPVSPDENGNAANKNVRVNKKAVKLETQEEALKIKANKEKQKPAN